jgi:hypothetical protein
VPCPRKRRTTTPVAESKLVKAFLLLFFKKDALSCFDPAKESASFLKKRSKKLL